jgi:alpha-galactosidase
MKIFVAALVLLAIANLSTGLNNGLARLPPMGWSTWCTDDYIPCESDYCSEKEVKEVADAMVKSGMRDAGYTYVNLDDCWGGPRDNNGHLTADKSRFPSGSLKPLADYLHSIGMKLGVYVCAGNFTCKGYRPGSWGHYDDDAQTMANWDVDLVKMDFCYHPALPPKQVYGMMRDSLNKTRHPMVFSVCEWGKDNPWEWGMETANMWRVTNDHMPFFYLPFGHTLGWSTQDIIEAFAGVSKFAGPGGWNDADFLMTGALTMSDIQSRTEFSFWALFASPLIVTTDVRDMSNKAHILLNQEIIAVNQDPLGIPGDRLYKFDSGGQIWAKPLSNKDFAVIFYNYNFFGSVEMVLNWSDLGFSATASLKVRDLWLHEDIGVFYQNFKAKVAGHDVLMIRVSLVSN